MIPEGWKLDSIENIISKLEAGVSVNAEDRPRQQGEIGVLKVSAVSYGQFDPAAYKTVLKAEENRLQVFAQKDRIIVSRANTYELVGASAYIADDYPQLFLPDKLWLLSLKEAYNARWFSYILASDEMRSRLSGLATGTSGSMKNISQDAFLSLVVSIPPLPEQRKIAAILSTWDDAITLVEKLIDALRQRKQALMQLLLTGEVRFKEFEGEEWEEYEFSEIAYRTGKQINPAESDNDLPCVELEHISQKTGNILGFTTLREQKSLKNYFSAGQILFGKLRPYLRKYAQPNFDGAASSEIWVLAAHSEYISNDYLFYIVQSDTFANAANVTSGTKMPRADWETVSETVFLIPSIQQQNQIVDLLHLADEELKILESTEQSLHVEKRALMQQLLTGALRVQPDE